MTSPADEPASATEQVVRLHAAELGELAAAHGIHDLRFASAGRLLGRVDPDRDMLDMAAFAADAEDLLGALRSSEINHHVARVYESRTFAATVAASSLTLSF